MKTITIYSKPNCQQCNATYRWLDKRDIAYKVEDATRPDHNAAIKSLGYLMVPVVVVSNGDPETDLHWSGFQPDNLKRYCLPDAAA